jgi:rhodanese-related sulfurtransferase
MLMISRLLAVCVLISTFGSPVRAIDPRIRTAVDVFDIGPEKKTLLDLYVTSREAARAVQRHPDILLIDVRAPSDIEAKGIPVPVHRNIPFLIPRDSPDQGLPPMMINPRLVSSVDRLLRAKRLDRDATIMVLCVAGVHSARATDYLAERGFRNVYSIVDGYEGDKAPNGDRSVNGWRNHKLPWSASPRADQIASAR